MSATPSAPVSRRSALAVGALLATAGCDLDPRAATPAVPAPTSGAPRDPDEESDLALLDEVRTATAAALAGVLAARGADPGLRTTLRPLLLMHRAHARALDDAATSTPTSSPAATEPGAAVGTAGVRRLETALQRRLADGAVRAASGEFARLLASMSASVAQHVARLPGRP